MSVPNINQQPTLATAEITKLQRLYWRKKLAHLTVKADPVMAMVESESMGGVHSVGNAKENRLTAIPNKAIQHITSEVGTDNEGKAVHEIFMGMKLPLSGLGKEGEATFMGDEETYKYKYTKAAANDLGHAVSLTKWGINSREMLPQTDPETVMNDLGLWLGEMKGKMVRESLIRRYCSNLTQAPISRIQAFNPHTVFLGTGSASNQKIAYDSTDATFNASVCAYGNGKTQANHRPTISNLIALTQILEDNYINTTSHEGNDLWFFLMHPRDIKHLIDPATVGGFGAYVKDISALPDPRITKITHKGRYVIADSLVVVEDPRLPVVDFPTASTSSFHYLMPGRNDQRTGLAGTNKWYANLLIGENALICHNPEDFRRREDKQQHGKFESVLYNGAISYQIPMYDNDVPDNDSLISEGSAVVFTSAVY
jgi:hypothetical protein